MAAGDLSSAMASMFFLSAGKHVETDDEKQWFVDVMSFLIASLLCINYLLFLLLGAANW